ncbi:MAG: YIP1 family protein [Gallionella sp.]
MKIAGKHGNSSIAMALNRAIRLLGHPVVFFRTMPKTGSLLEPLHFIALTGALDVTLINIRYFSSHGAGIHELALMASNLILVLLIAIVGGPFVAGLMFAIWSLMGSTESYATSFRCMAYTQIVVPFAILLSIVPYLGLLGIVWWITLMVIATRDIHKQSIRQALAVFGTIGMAISLVYYNAVSSNIQARQHLQEFTRELQKMPNGSKYK